MSPRRKLEPESVDLPEAAAPMAEAPVAQPRSWVGAPPRRRPGGLPVAAALAVLVMVAALTASVFLVRSHVENHRNTIANASVLAYVRQFMTHYTSPDPFNANGYTDQIQQQATGDFAKQFEEKKTQTLVQVAMAQPTEGTVTEAGVENWSGDGSANVIVVTTISSTSPDGKTPVETGIRWLVTAVKEGNQWKVSSLREAL